MYPNPYHFRGPSSGAWNSGQAPPQPPPPPPPPPPHLPPPQQPPLQLLNTNFSLPNQNPTNSSYIQPPNPNFPPHHTQNPYPTFPPNNFPIRPLENSTFTPQHLTNLLFWLQILSQNSNSALRPQRLSENPNGNVAPQQPSNSAFRPQSSSENPKEMVERIDSAVEKARGEFVAAGRSVSAWKVLQSALLMLKVDDLNSLGLQMHQVSSLHRLMLTEGRINGFIHCFVLVRRITSLYDLELAICKNEDVEKFEELGLGPLLQHPLVLHYFPVSSDTTEVFKITSEEIMLSLIAFQKQKLKVKDGDAEEFLDFIVKKRSVASKEKLGIRIYGLGMHTSCMREARKLERVTLRKSEKQSKQISAKTSRRRPPIFSSLKKRLDKNFRAISQRAHLFSVVHKDSCGKQDRFISSSGKDLHEDDDRDKDHVTGSQVNFSSQSAKSSGRVSSCTYLSAIEERSLLRSTDLSPANGTQKHNEGNGSTQNKRKYENLINPTSVPPKMHKRDKVEQDVLPTMNGQETEEARNMQKKDLSIANDSLRMFITTWKEACREQTVAEVLWSMLRSYRRSPKRIISMFSAYPLIGLLNVAISSIKCGMWDTMYDTFQSIGQHGLTNTSTRKYSEYFTTDVEPIIKDVPPVSNEHITERRHNNRLRQRALGQPIRSIRKIIQKSQKKNTLKGSSKGAHPQLKTCFLCRQVGHLRKNCPRLQQAGSSLVPQDSQQLAQYPAQSHPVQPQPQQSTSTAPMPQNSGRGFVTCGPAGRGQVTVTGGESMEVNVNSVIDGSTEKQTKSFILNNEKVLKLSSGESVLSLSSGISLTEVNEQKSLKTKREAINLPPVYLNTAPGFGCSEANLFKTHAPVAQLSSALETKMHDNPEVTVGQIANLAPISVDVNWTIEDDSATSAALVLPDSHNLQEHSGDACNETDTGFHIEFDPINIGFVSHSSELGSSNFSKRDQPRYGTPNGGDAMLTGRLGELVAFKYLIAKAGKPVVRWVNECNETGLPYDIVVGEKENSTEFVEVKATQSPRKDWFRISTREWQFAVDKGEAFSIVHVLLLGNNAARVSVYKNPVKLCHLGKLQLLLTMSKPQKELFLLS